MQALTIAVSRSVGQGLATLVLESPHLIRKTVYRHFTQKPIVTLCQSNPTPKQLPIRSDVISGRGVRRGARGQGSGDEDRQADASPTAPTSELDR